MMQKTNILKKMKKKAEDSEPVSNTRLVAAIIHKGKVVSYGKNQYKTHPTMIKFSKNPHAIFLHAEVDAINKAKKVLSREDLSKTKLIVMRILKDGTYANAKPCCGCSKCIEHYGITNVIYTTGETTNVLGNW